MKTINWKDEKKISFWKNIILFRWDRLVQKRDKNQWVFGGREGYNYDDNSRTFFEWINTHHPEIKTAWMCRTPELQKRIKNLGYNAYLFESNEGVEFCKHAGVACYSHGMIDFGLHPRIGGATIVTYWHGAGFKKIYRLSHHGIALWAKILADYLFSWSYRDITIGTSKFHLRQFEQNFGLKKSDPRLICGQPRNDTLFSGITKADLLSNTDINPNKNIILYMPTYRGSSMGTNAMSEIINQLYSSIELNEALEKTNSVFVAKLHPLTPHINIKNRSNFKILDYGAVEDNQKLLAVGDMMISDYSATIVDFALLERPVIFYMPDHETFIKNSEPLFDEFYNLCKYDNCTTPKALAESILHPSKAAVNAINELFEDANIKGTCYCENVYNAISKEIDIIKKIQ